MTSITEKIQQYYGLKPAIEFPFLNRLEWTTIPLVPVPACTHHLRLHFGKSPAAGSEKELVLEFRDVSSVQLSLRSRGVVLEIRDVSGRQWEGVNYEVRDLEEGTISFLCRDFSLSLREATS